MSLLTKCVVCDGRLTCPERPAWVASLCILSPGLVVIAAAIVAGMWAQ